MRTGSLPKLLVLLFVCTVSVLIVSAQPREDCDLGENRDLSILYAGYPGDARGIWVEFLRRWFRKVDAINLMDLDLSRAAAYDVVVADWRQEKDDSNPEITKHLPPGFTKPVIMIGLVSGSLVRDSKIRWG